MGAAWGGGPYGEGEPLNSNNYNYKCFAPIIYMLHPVDFSLYDNIYYYPSIQPI